MAALTQDRTTPERDGRRVSDPLAPGVTIYAGAMYCLNAAGQAVPAGHPTATTNARGVAVKRAAATDGDAVVEGALGVFCFDNDVAEPVTRARIGDYAYAVDDQTAGAGGSVLAGAVFDVDDRGVWIIVARGD